MLRLVEPEITWIVLDWRTCYFGVKEIDQV
jgi:hypothetical protein